MPLGMLNWQAEGALRVAGGARPPEAPRYTPRSAVTTKVRILVFSPFPYYFSSTVESFL